MKNKLFEIWFALRVGAASTEFQTLLEHYGSPYELFNADDAELDTLPVSPALRQSLGDKSLQESSRIMEYCEKNGCGILFWQDENYPIALRSLRDPPVLLYYRGRLPDFNRRLCISVVGTRKMSEYGKRMAYKIGYELASAGAIVISGMALGNDSVATAGAICAGGTPVAILGGGIDVIYPREHEHLYGEIARSGVVMTEYPPGTPPAGYHFPVRNRIISGLSQGTLVIEGDLKSGALITAKTAILQGRDIYAIPGNVGEANSAGSNQLISDGAAVVLGARDIVENYTFLYRDDLDLARLSRAEKYSDLDAESLRNLGVFTRTLKPEPGKTTPPPPAPTPRSRPTPQVDAPPQPARRAPRPATPTPGPTPARASTSGDASRRALESLTDLQRRVFESLPIDGTIALDSLSKDGFSMSDVLSSVTILEIKGLVQTFPGGLIGRK